uniref:Uncharacterized protein n=1 Tax=Ascaris lumbricoides TaxID=6252 RepID=A0A0M3HTS8_ASCLU
MYSLLNLWCRFSFQYNFHNERKAIAEYEKEKAARSSVAKEEPTYSKAVSTTLPLTLDTALRKVRSEGILEPSPAPLNNNSLRKTKSKKMNAVNSFEEFEAKPSLFDLLEMNTIDDKAALEEVLLASVKGGHTFPATVHYSFICFEP